MTTDPVPQLKVTVQPTFGGQPFYLDSTYTLSDGTDIQLTDIKFYFTDIRNGSQLLTDAARFDYREKGTTCVKVAGKKSDFLTMTGLIGVDASINHNDPASFPNASELNIMNANGMHWSWNTGYIFIIIEGKADTIPDGTALFDHYLTYHIGTDDYLGNVSFPTVTWNTTGSYESTFPLELDMKAVFDHPVNPISVQSESVTHSSASQATLTQKILSNFLDALTAP